MSLDVEDKDDDFHSSTNLLYKPVSPTIGEEKPVLDEPVGNQQVFGNPKDHWNATYIIFFLLGTNSLLPLNFIITAKHYWMYKLQNCSEETSLVEQGSSDIRNFFESYISVASTVPSVLSLIGNFLLVNKVSANVRILSSLAVMLAVFLVITVLVKVDTSAWTLWFFIITIVCVVVLSSAATIFFSSVFGLSGCFPIQNSQALISGQAMGGTVSALASVVDLAASSEVTNSALAYFLIVDIFIVLCVVMYLILLKLEYSRYHITRQKSRRRPPNPLPSSDLEEQDMASGSSSQQSPTSNYTGRIPPLWLILKKIGMLGFCIFYVYFISIIIFPAISSGIESVNKFSGSPWTDKYFIPLTSFLLYNVADWCGRQITAWIQVPGPHSKWLPTVTLLRTFFIPIFMLCNYQPRMHIAKVVFAQDVYPVVFIVFLGLSNGYLSTLSIIYGPKVTPNELSEAAGVLMVLFLQVGLALGSGFSVLVVHLI
ncbi:equilibrative nucleoside transporter 3 [Python bivittatus]|uniref:Equilibrative nucleoside transporter 3 n=1 Tax=Python bivittatus TaxID=176946 RepID=A0A9F2R016_PYTBI|nr:equilibrative nucleoside transporter 3 [Python bivittatus]